MPSESRCENNKISSYYHELKPWRLFRHVGYDSRMMETECRVCGLKLYRAPRFKVRRIRRQPDADT